MFPQLFRGRKVAVALAILPLELLYVSLRNMTRHLLYGVQRNLPLLLIGLFLWSCGEQRESTTATIGPITSAVYASGVVKARGQYVASAVVSGVLARSYVQPGDTVAAGDPLFRIDDRSSSLMARNAGSAYDLAVSNAADNSPMLQERTLAVQLAQEKLHNDSLLFARQKSLWEQQVGSRVEFEQRELAYRSSRSALANAKAALVDTRRQLRNNLEVTYNNLLNTQAMKDDHLVRSLVDGRVYDVTIEPGELVTPQQPLAVLGSKRDFEMELEVDEFDIARVRVGQPIHITMDSHRGSVFHGQVSRVEPFMDVRSRTFTVRASFTEGPEVLYPNLTVEANIVVAHKERALTIPAAYVVDGAVLVGPEERRDIEVGLRDLQRVEVLGGLDSGTVILKP